jgi:hypothetical protein
MKKLAILVLFTVSCGGSDSTSTPPPITEVDAAPPVQVDDCFKGTPTTHDELINACVDQSVTRIIKYPNLPAMRAALPLLNSDGTVPALP